jgi:coenzyme F420-reducing hydrogenase alpha subunit
MNNVAQLVECIHVTFEAIRLTDELLAGPPGETLAPVEPRAGEGVGAVEVPRGILYHHYSYGDEGRILRANCVIPTTQNNANIHHDLSALVKQLAARGTDDEELERVCSMLVRAYDPCLSCSVH